ncbi:hypothetical protein [Azospirillum agricola]|uniref:hypothetical protein n=1 Tax=Azospirillum agricola TaxID=1720247 RepID=UPI0015C4412A|nr:hypothetical protein [Azospirillum agricola]MBP2227258.1 hypothetical protein [Azospirillum agricola]
MAMLPISAARLWWPDELGPELHSSGVCRMNVEGRRFIPHETGLVGFFSADAEA